MGQDPSAVGTRALAAVSAPPQPPPEDPGALRADIERTRLDLGDTVAALAEKTDVKARAKEKVAEVRHNVDREARPSSWARRASRARTARARRPSRSARRRRRTRSRRRRSPRSSAASCSGASRSAASARPAIEDGAMAEAPARDTDRTAPTASAPPPTRTPPRRRTTALRRARRRRRDGARAPSTRPRARRRHRPAEAVVEGRHQARVARVQRRQRHRLGRRADLLRRPVDLPDAARAGLAARAVRPVGDAAAARQPQLGRPRPGEGHPHAGDPEPAEEPGRRRA